MHAFQQQPSATTTFDFSSQVQNTAFAHLDTFGLLIHYDSKHKEQPLRISLSGLDDLGITGHGHPCLKRMEVRFFDVLFELSPSQWHPLLHDKIERMKKQSEPVAFHGALVFVRSISNTWQAVSSFVVDGHHLKSHPFNINAFMSNDLLQKVNPSCRNSVTTRHKLGV